MLSDVTNGEANLKGICECSGLELRLFFFSLILPLYLSLYYMPCYESHSIIIFHYELRITICRATLGKFYCQSINLAGKKLFSGIKYSTIVGHDFSRPIEDIRVWGFGYCL